MSLIDSHCHLQYDYQPKTCADLIREANEAGVEAFLTVGTDLNSIPLVQKISEEFENVYHTVGVHPHDAATLTEQGLSILEASSKHTKCRAIGEIGLDFHYDHSPRNTQIDQLEQQLALALKTQLPVVIHSREGETELLAALARYSAQIPGSRVPGVIHCFSGTLEFGKSCLDLGFYLSFSGILTFKNAEEIRASARVFPLERLLVETDSPYLAPIPFRGKKCEPSMVKYTAQKLSEVKSIPFEDVARMTTANTKKVFRLQATGFS